MWNSNFVVVGVALICSFVVVDSFSKLPSISNLKFHRSRSHQGSSTCLADSSSFLLGYDIMTTISPEFVGQCVGCAGLITAGSVIEIDDDEDEILSEEEEKEIDIYRDSVLRYAGYLNEIGEAFRPIIPGGIVTASYVGAITYVLADARSKASYNTRINEGNKSCGLAGAIDTLAFQFIASIIFPGFVVNRWVALCAYLDYEQLDVSKFLSTQLHIDPTAVITELAGTPITPESVASSVPTVCGLALIPLIVKPLDVLTEKILDLSVRPWIRSTFTECNIASCNNEECVIDYD